MEPHQPRGPPPSHLVTKAAAPRFEGRLEARPKVPSGALTPRTTAPPRMTTPPVARPPRMTAPPPVPRPPVAPPPVAEPPVAPSSAVAPTLLRPQRARHDDEFVAPSLDEDTAVTEEGAAAVTKEGTAAVAEEGGDAVTEEGGDAEEGAAAVTEEGAAVTEEGGDAEEGAAAVTEEAPTPPPPASEVWLRKRPRAEIEAEGDSAVYSFSRARGEGWDAEAAAIRLPPVVPEALRRGGEGTEWEIAPWWPDIEVHHRRYMQSLVLAFQYWVEASAQYHAFAAEMRRLGLGAELAAAKATYDQAWADWTEQVQFEVAEDGTVDWSWRPGSHYDVASRQHAAAAGAAEAAASAAADAAARPQ